VGWVICYRMSWRIACLCVCLTLCWYYWYAKTAESIVSRFGACVDSCTWVGQRTMEYAYIWTPSGKYDWTMRAWWWCGIVTSVTVASCLSCFAVLNNMQEIFNWLIDQLWEFIWFYFLHFREFGAVTYDYGVQTYWFPYFTSTLFLQLLAYRLTSFIALVRQDVILGRSNCRH